MVNKENIKVVSVVGRDEVGQGKEIDKADLVVRMSYFGPHVKSGKKYDIGVLLDSNCQFGLVKRREKKGNLKKPRLGWWWYACRGHFEPEDVLDMPVLKIATQDFLKQFTPEGFLLTKGGVALILAIQEFAPCRINAFGFGRVLGGDKHINEFHDFVQERRSILNFAKEKEAEIYYGRNCIT